MIELHTIKKIHFIGIGGIGVSAIARMFLLEGKEVSGSDRSKSVITDELEKLGATIYEGHAKGNVPEDCDLVVYTIAVGDDNPERGVCDNELTYPEVLGLISKDKFTIAVSGTHGKTTTTAMIAKIMIDAGLNPTVIVGSLLKDVKSNFVAGDSKYLVVEACEYRRSFLNLHPTILVITNIEADHLDYYKDLDDIKSAFEEMKAKVQDGGVIITEKEYSEAPHDFQLQAPGEHNIKNAQAAYMVGRELDIPEEAVRKSLAEFSGTWRRFDFLGKTKEGVLVYDDYAHHPDEVRATLKGFREKYPDKKILVIFQPHLYSRTKLLLNEFAKSFSDADRIIITPIYAAREEKDESISHTMLANMSGAEAVDRFDEIDIGDAEVIVVMGAGDIRKVGEDLL